MSKVLIIVENLPVPNDRRVWLEATALRDAGYTVSVISIKGKNANKTYEQLDGIHVYRYPTPPATEGAISFIIEFSYCWIMSFLLSIVVLFRHGFKIIHACNPPETFWAIGAIYKLIGKKFLFDHHDLSPEMYASRFGKTEGIAYRGLLALEKMTFRVADVVLTTNETHKKVAIERGEYPDDKIYIVRSGPDHNVLRPAEPDPSIKGDFTYMVSYLGVINPQDGVDTLIEAAKYIVHELGRTDVLFKIMGTGDALDQLKELVKSYDLETYVSFTGWVEQDDIRRILSTSDVAVDTMPKNPYSDAATLNKILEYMSVAVPIVCFDLRESRVSAQDAAVYVKPDDVVDLSEKILELLEDEPRRAMMGKKGRQRIETELAWEYQSQNLLAAYNTLSN